MQLTEHFKLSEFNCKDGTEVPQNLIPYTYTLCLQLEILRDTLKSPIKIVSGYRSPEYNRKIDGALRSLHMEGKAADIQVNRYNPKWVYDTILSLISQNKIKNGGVGLYKTFVHYDIGPTRRWRG